MIRVREDQLEAFARAMELEHFEDDMVVHLRDFAPRHAEVIGDAWIRRAVRLGIERAGAYGVKNPGLLRFHVELMMLHGSAFDADPLHPWAGEVLRDPHIPDEVARMSRLYEAFVAYRERAGDPVTALGRLAGVLDGGFDPAELRAEPRAVALLAKVHPERCAYLGEARLVDLVRRAPAEAARHDLGTDRGAVLVAGLMFGLGPAFADDPLYPWIQATLRDTAEKDAERRAERLQRRLRIYVGRAAAYLERKRADVL
jgi:hypothetical protein